MAAQACCQADFGRVIGEFFHLIDIEVTGCTIGHKSLQQQMIGVFIARKNQDLSKMHLQQIDQKTRHLRASLILAPASATSVPEPIACLLALLALDGVSARR